MLQVIKLQQGSAQWYALVHFFCIEGTAIGSHQASLLDTDDLSAQFHLKGTEDCIIEEGSALYHYVVAQHRGVCGADHLVEGVLHYADGKTCKDIRHCRTVLLGLFDRTVHEDRTPASQVNRVFCLQGHLCRLFRGVAKGVGEGLQEGATT